MSRFFEVDVDTLLRAMRCVSVARAKDVTRPNLTCVSFVYKGAGERVTLNATDGYWLAQWTFGADVDGGAVPFEMAIVPSDAMRIRRAMRDLDGSEDVRVWPRRRVVRAGRTLLSLQPYTGPSMPPYAQVIPKLEPSDGVQSIAVDACLLAKVSKAIGLGLDDRVIRGTRGVVLNFSGNVLDPILVTSPDLRDLTVVLMPCRADLPVRKRAPVASADAASAPVSP